MNFDAVKFVVRKYSSGENRRGFVNFVWWAAIVSISLGVIALLVSTSILDGFQNAIQENAIRFTSHIKVLTFNRQPIENVNQVVYKILAVEGVENAFPTVSKEVLIRTQHAVEGIALQSLNSKNIESLKRVELTQNKDVFNIDGIIVGKMLADRLGLKIGDSVLIMSINVLDSFSLPEAKFVRTTIAGVFESGMAKYDDLFAYANFDLFYKLYPEQNQVANAIDVYVKDLRIVDTVSSKIESSLGYPFYCFTYYDLHSSIFAWIELQKEPIPIVLSLITLVAIFNVVTFLLVNVVEKTKSIGIFSTLGFTSKEIAFVFLSLGMKISFVGLILGVGVSLIFSLLQKNFGIIHLDSKIYYFSFLPISISFWNYAVVVVFTLTLTFVISIIPSIIASKVNPVRAIRFIK
ncbi:MAG: hypothetical protein CH6_3789 [Candidatus Kapaibacterium sp.]|nr:MAG: hypothetical protein CH6_3789 [Candidatus Kapabacteria bacterium]